jgi:hypothetical protein
LDPEDRGSNLLRNIYELLPDYMLYDPRRFSVEKSFKMKFVEAVKERKFNKDTAQGAGGGFLECLIDYKVNMQEKILESET